jgi:hypothetical protein
MDEDEQEDIVIVPEESFFSQSTPIRSVPPFSVQKEVVASQETVLSLFEPISNEDSGYEAESDSNSATNPPRSVNSKKIANVRPPKVMEQELLEEDLQSNDVPRPIKPPKMAQVFGGQNGNEKTEKAHIQLDQIFQKYCLGNPEKVF